MTEERQESTPGTRFREAPAIPRNAIQNNHFLLGYMFFFIGKGNHKFGLEIIFKGIEAEN